MTEKDRPRKKDWKREYEKSKEPGRYNNNTNPALLLFDQRGYNNQKIDIVRTGRDY